MDAVEDIKSRLAIEDVIGEYVELKRAGRNWRGLSPFSSEKSPSFMVSPEKQIWHDFSSGKGGNMFSFVMELEGLDFKGALELLARKAGVDLAAYRQSGKSGVDKERLFSANEAAVHFYQVQFSKSKIALEYVFKQRQFAKQTALDWRLGYSPTSGTELLNYLKNKGFTDSEIKRAGLLNSYGKDMFRGRLMVPLADPQGRTVGFTARLLTSDKNAPKYINTPQSPLYDKSRHVYGLHHAKEAIRKSGYVVMVEGNLDVIASHGAGVKNVVATAGTALTEQHLKTLARFTADIRLAFDADKAGLAATERAISLASRLDLTLNIITVPSGKDPDELIKNSGVEAWQKAIEAPEYALDWLISRHQKLIDVSTAQGKRQFTSVLLPIVNGLKDSVEQDHYLRKIADILEVSVDALNTKMGQSKVQTKQLKKPKVDLEITDKASADARKSEDGLLSILLTHPSLRGELTIILPEMFTQELANKLLDFLRANPDYYTQVDGAEQGNLPQELAEYVKILLLEYEELYQGIDLNELRHEVLRLQAKLIEAYVKNEKAKLRQKYSSDAEASQRSLAEESREYDLLLSKVKGF